MMTKKTTYFQFFISAILVASLFMPLVYQAPDVLADGTEDLRHINYYLDYEGSDRYMNPKQAATTPADENGQTSPIIWDYGWWDGSNVANSSLLSDLYVEGTHGDEVYVKVGIANLLGGNNKDVTMALLDNEEVVAEVTIPLAGSFTPEDNDDWFLPFVDDSNFHIFPVGHLIKVRASWEEGGNVNIEYDVPGGPARLELNANQIEQEEFRVEDTEGNDKNGEEFVPKFPEESGLGIAHIYGSFLDTFTFRDVDTVNLSIEAPDHTVHESGPITPQHRSSDMVVFHFNWSYGDVMNDEQDAGEYEVTIYITDLNGNSYVHEDVLNFEMSKYGVYLTLADDEEPNKGAPPGGVVHYKMVVFNAGLVDGDTFDLSYSELAGDWTVSIDPESVVLDSEESSELQVNVTIPEDEEVGASRDLKVTATSRKSTEDPAYEDATWDVRTTTTVIATANVLVTFKETDSQDDGSEFVDNHHKNGKAEKGMDRDLTFWVKNDSPDEDTISLKLNGIPNDWSAAIIHSYTKEEVNSVQLDGNGETKLMVRVRPATSESAANLASLEITGVSGNNESVLDTVFLEIERTLGIVITTHHHDKLLDLRSGIPNNIEFTLENMGDEDRTFYIDIDLAKLDPEQWGFEIGGGPTVDISAEDSTIVTLDVTPSDNAIVSEEGYEFTLIAEDTEDETIHYEFPGQMNVRPIYGIELEIAGDGKTIESSGGSVEYIVMVRNQGNSEVVIIMEIERDQEDWMVLIDKTLDIIEPFSAQKEFLLKVTAPEDAEDGEECMVYIIANILEHGDFEIRDRVTTSLHFNEPPRATFISISPNPAEFSETILFEGAGDDDGEIVRYLWTSSIDGEIYNGSESDFSTHSLSAGEHLITFRVQDNGGVWSNMDEETLTVRAQNEFPIITIQTPTHQAVIMGEVTFSGIASDEDGKVEKIQISLFNGTWVRISGVTAWNYVWDTTEIENGMYTFRVRCFDGTNYSEEAVITVIVENPKDDGDDDLIPGFEAIAVVSALSLALIIFRRRF